MSVISVGAFNFTVIKCLYAFGVGDNGLGASGHCPFPATSELDNDSRNLSSMSICRSKYSCKVTLRPIIVLACNPKLRRLS